MTEYANFDDAHVPAPADHAPRKTAYESDGSGPRARLVVGEGESRDGMQRSGAWLSSSESVEVWP